LTETLDNGYAKDWEGAEGVLNKAIIALLQRQINIKPNITKSRDILLYASKFLPI